MENNLKDQHYKNMGIMLQMETLTFEAESVAFVVSTFLGLDTSDYSFPYIVGWEENDESLLRHSLKRIRDAAHVLITQIEEELNKDDLTTDNITTDDNNNSKAVQGMQLF
mgnify:CR=1 FL=1